MKGTPFKRRLIEGDRVRRRCLRCDESFLAVGRFNRLCEACQTYAEIHSGDGDSPDHIWRKL